jgi:PST family polysaccharide transporter
MTGSLGRQVAVAAAFMIAGRVAIRLISVVSTLILVRLLVPEDFGIIALAGAIFTIADTLTSTGYSALLVRRREVDRDAYDTAWTLNIIRCAALALLVVATAPLQADLFDEPRITPVLAVAAATMMLDGFSSIGMARMQRQLRFAPLFRLQVAQRLLAFVFTVLIAWIWASYWALVLGNLVAKLLTVPYSYWLAPHRPRLRLTYWREFLGFSGWMFGFNLCSAVEGQSANLALGATAGSMSVGRYNVAYQIGASPVTEIAVPLREPLYSGFAQALSEEDRLRHLFVQTLGLLVTLLLPLSLGIALVADEIAAIALGSSWSAMGPLIALCALYALFDSLAQHMKNILILKDRLRLLVVTSVAVTGIRAPIVWAAAWSAGEVGMLTASLVMALGGFVAWSATATAVVGCSSRRLVAACWRPVLAGLAMAAAVLALRGVLPAAADGIVDDMLRLAIAAAVGAVVHIGTQLLLWLMAGLPDGAERRLANSVGGLVRRRPRHHAAPGTTT